MDDAEVLRRWKNRHDDEVKTFADLTAAGEAGSSLAWRVLGDFYLAQDSLIKARNMYERAAANVINEPQMVDIAIKCGMMMLEGEGGKKDLKKARVLLEGAAVHEDHEGLYWVGILYLDGKGGIKDVKKAIEILKRAAEKRKDTW